MFDTQPDLPPLSIYTAGAITPHVASVSVPIIGEKDRLVEALSLAGPEARLTEKRGSDVALPLLRAGL